MKTFRIQLLLNGPLTYLPDSQTLFGALCYLLESAMGKDELESFLHLVHQKKKKFAVSSVFLHDTLPFPIGIEPSPIAKEEMNPENYTKLKKTKRIRWMSRRLFELYKKDMKQFNQFFYQQMTKGEYHFFEKLELLVHREERPSFSQIEIKKYVATRNHVSLIEEEKDLFYTSKIYFSKDTMFDVFLYCTEDRMLWIEKALQQSRYITIGGKRSLGMNLFEFHNLEEYQFSESKQKVLLSKGHINLQDVDLNQAFYRISIRDNKNDNRFSAYRYKTPILVFEEGSTFVTEAKVMGALVPEDFLEGTIYQNAMALLV